MNDSAGNDLEIATNSERIDIRHYWHIILERRWLLVMVWVLLFAGCLLYLKRAPRIYEASTRLQIDKPADNMLSIKDVSVIDASEEVYLQTQIKKLQSGSLLKSVLDGLQWGNAPRPSVDVDLIKSTHLVDVRVGHPDAQKAAQAANRLVEAFIQTNLADRMSSSLDAVHWLQSEADQLKQGVQEAEMALQDYKRRHSTVPFENGSEVWLQNLQRIMTDLDEAKLKAAAARELAQTAETILQGTEPSGAANAQALGAFNPKYGVLENAPRRTARPTREKSDLAIYTRLAALQPGAAGGSLNALIQQLDEKEANLAGMLTRYRNEWPAVKELRTEIEQLRSRVEKESRAILASLRTEAEHMEARVSDLQELQSQLQRRHLEENNLRIHYEELKREAEQRKLIYSGLLARMKETELLGKLPVNTIKIVEPAKVPKSPARPQVAQILVAGFILSMAAAMGLVFFVNYLDDAVKSQEDVEVFLRQKFLGYIPRIRAESGIDPRLPTHQAPQTLGAEAFRTIRAALTLSYDPEHLRVMSVTSTLPGEGKSFVASNLAVVLAQTGLRTLLIDTDFRHPTVHQMFKAPRNPGLSSLLLGKVEDVDSVIVNTEAPNLDIICAGSIPSFASELAGSNSMKQVLAHLRERYDRIVIDCPPAAAVSDALIVASLTDGILFVARFSKVRKDYARRCLQRIQESRIPILGVVTNYIDFEGKDSHYADEYFQTRYYQTLPQQRTQPAGV